MVSYHRYPSTLARRTENYDIGFHHQSKKALSYLNTPHADLNAYEPDDSINERESNQSGHIGNSVRRTRTSNVAKGQMQF